jgi:hypothetical protein
LELGISLYFFSSIDSIDEDIATVTGLGAVVGRSLVAMAAVLTAAPDFIAANMSALLIIPPFEVPIIFLVSIF